MDRAQVVVVVIDASRGVTSGRHGDRRRSLASSAAGWWWPSTNGTWSTRKPASGWRRSWPRIAEMLAEPERVNLSALTGRHVERLMPAVARTLDRCRLQLGTGEINRLFEKAIAAHPPPSSRGRGLEALLRHPGEQLAAHLHALRQQHPGAPEHLPALPGEPPAGRSRPRRHPDPPGHPPARRARNRGRENTGKHQVLRVLSVGEAISYTGRPHPRAGVETYESEVAESETDRCGKSPADSRYGRRRRFTAAPKPTWWTRSTAVTAP